MLTDTPAILFAMTGDDIELRRWPAGRRSSESRTTPLAAHPNQSESDGISRERAARDAGAGPRRASPMIWATAET